MKSSGATVVLKGGAGNQLFQYALALNLRDVYQYNVRLESSYLLCRPAFGRYTKRQISLPDINIEHPISFSPAFILRYILANMTGSSKMGKIVSTVSGLEQIVQSVCRSNLICDGYWQNVHMANRVKSQLQKGFVLRDRISSAGDQMLAKIQSSSSSVAIHVRRGDYVSNKAVASQHGAMQAHYFTQGIEYLCRIVGNSDLFVFSDDIQWCKQKLKADRAIFCERDNFKSISPYEDMYLMSRCTHKIISNSTFSWWAAYLGDTGGQVVAPKQWFANGRHAELDLHVATWHYL